MDRADWKHGGPAAKPCPEHVWAPEPPFGKRRHGFTCQVHWLYGEFDVFSRSPHSDYGLLKTLRIQTCASDTGIDALAQPAASLLSPKVGLVVPDPEPAPVPAPVPVMAVAAAFGWSRKMRERIRLSRTRQNQPSYDGKVVPLFGTDSTVQ